VFELPALSAGHCRVTVRWESTEAVLPVPLDLDQTSVRRDSLRLTTAGALLLESAAAPAPEATGGEQLSSRQVSGLPLNKRDFSQLLLPTAGTQTDTNGAAVFTNVVSKSGSDQFHGSAFEFLRNTALDARNFFDRRSPARPGRIPPFARNEFGWTFEGPLLRNRTFFFGEYQGFRRVLGTTQVLPVPAADERAGLNTTAFPGDTLMVPVSPQIAPVLARYPLPSDPQGPYGARSYAVSSKVRTDSDQFSVRLDRRLSNKSQLFVRFSFNNVDSPLTNPSQTAIDPSYAIPFFDRQRSFGLTYTRTPSAGVVWQTSAGLIRATPNFPTLNRTQPALTFADGTYEAVNAAAGSIMGAFGTFYQLHQNVSWTKGSHNWKTGAELRLNHDTTVFGTSPNGAYTFGGGAAYAPVAIRSPSGRHDIPAGGTGPNRGRSGTLGRNTFRAPAFHNFDFSLTKNTPIGAPANPECIILQTRTEFFNVLNVVNLASPPTRCSAPDSV
jgi:hypothetical protein